VLPPVRAAACSSQLHGDTYPCSARGHQIVDVINEEHHAAAQLSQLVQDLQARGWLRWCGVSGVKGGGGGECSLHTN